MNFSTNSILLSTSATNDKKAVYGFEVMALQSLNDLQHVMNTKAVSSGLYLSGHRSSDFLKACGNVYLIDVDIAPLINETAYYKNIENKLKDKNISFVSVPSQSANVNIYKRHIAIILDGCLPVSTKQYKLASNYILDYIGADKTKLDMNVALDTVRQLAPASINKSFNNANDMSNYYEGEPLSLPNEFKGNNSSSRDVNSDINTNTLITFSDTTTVSIYNAKKIINAGDKKSCYCINPLHNDTKPSATFYHNDNGSVKVFCGKCGSIAISTNFIPTMPTVAHDLYQYSIVINKSISSSTSDLISKIGKCSHEDTKSLSWSFNVSSINDIYALLLAKAYLVDNGYEVSPFASTQTDAELLNTDVLKSITVNQTLLNTYVNVQNLTPYKLYYLQVKNFIYKKSYLFVEACIFAAFQNIIEPSRDFAITCNLGLAYFEYVLKTQHEQQHEKYQKNKMFPIRLSGSAKLKANEQRTIKSTQAKQQSMNIKQKQFVKLLNSQKYLKNNGNPNISAIANKLKINRSTAYEYMKMIKNKASKKDK